MKRATMGLDLSYTSTGLGVLIDGAYSSDWSEVVKTSKTKGGAAYESIERATRIANRIVHKAAQLAVQLEREQAGGQQALSIWIEGYAFGSFANREKLGELGGIVKSTLLSAGYEYEVLPVTSIRKFVCGKGNARKEMVMKSLLQRWEIDIDQNDLADAIALAKTGDSIWLDRAKQLDLEKLYADARTVIEQMRAKNTREESV